MAVSTLITLLLTVTCCIILNQVVVEGSNILFFHTVSTSSHRTAIWPLAEKLADKGHKVTYIFAVPKGKRVGSHPKIEEIIPSKMVPIMEHYILDFDINFRLNNSVNQWTYQIFFKCLELCEAFYDSPETKEWLARPNLSYDLIMIDQSFGECAYGLVRKFKAKHVHFVPVLPMFIWDGYGIVPETASIPEVFFHFKPNEMDFLGRLTTTASIFLWRLAFVDYMNKVCRIVSDKMNMPDLPAIAEFERNTSLVMVNSHYVEDYPMSLPPMFVSFSGLWCSKDKLKTVKPLPENLQSFVKDVDGFIYVSLGGAVVASKMPTELRDVYFKGFASFPTTKFLWRWTGEVPQNAPKNVLLLPWFPQRDILAHPKIKGFITQGGRPSTQEAICFGVPMITFPIFADQDYNSDRLEVIGVSISMDINTVTENSLKDSIKEILTNSTYRDRTKELSSLYKDRPMDPLENALYWTEFVLRNDNTALLKPLGLNYTWWQRRLLDVYAAMFVIVSAIIGITVLISYAILKCLGRFICKTKAKTD